MDRPVTSSQSAGQRQLKSTLTDLGTAEEPCFHAFLCCFHIEIPECETRHGSQKVKKKETEKEKAAAVSANREIFYFTQNCPSKKKERKKWLIKSRIGFGHNPEVR